MGGAQYETSRRVVPIVPPPLTMLKRAYLEQGRPDGKQLVCPKARAARHGLTSRYGGAFDGRPRAGPPVIRSAEPGHVGDGG
jgi:hypothetical protein